MAKRSVRKRRRMEAANSHTPVDTGCYADDCPLGATTTVNIDGKRYRVCDGHAELVMIQEQRRADHRRQQGDVDAGARRQQTEEALGLRPHSHGPTTKGHTP